MLSLGQASYGLGHLGYYFDGLYWEFTLGMSSFVRLGLVAILGCFIELGPHQNVFC